MGYPINVALRYLGSKKRAFISVGTAFAVLGVTLGVAALATVMSVTGGFQAQFREKVLGVNAHVLVLKYSTDFREYRSIMEQVSKVPGVVGTAPFSINPMMLTHGDATATGILLKGVDPAKSLGLTEPPSRPVLILPQQIVGCQDVLHRDGVEAAIACGQSKLGGLRLPNAKPAERRILDGRPNLFEDVDPLDAGAPSMPDVDDAGRDLRIIRAVEAEIRRHEREKDAGGSDDKVSPQSAVDAGAVDTTPAPVGNVAPKGGYGSKLPDDDVLPADVDPDPCANAAKVRELSGIVVGISLAKTLNVTIGDCVTVTSPTIGYSFSGGSLKPPVARRYRVIAMFEAGFDQYDSKLVYTDLYEAQTFYDQGDTVTGVEMIVDDIDKAPAISRQISELLSSGLYHTMDWEELNHGLFTALRIQQIGMSIVLALIIVVAAFTVVATLVMVVLDKTKEIAVMKAMGATDGAVLRIFLYQGGIIGGLGTTFGLLLGLLVCKGLLVYGFPLDPKVYFISRLPVLVRLQDFLITGQAALAICLEATILPSLYAAEMSPADGFRDQGGDNSTVRKRHWFTSAWLFRTHYGATIVAVVVLMLVEVGTLQPMWAFVAGLWALRSLFALATLLWRRWGLYGLLAAHGLAIALYWMALPYATRALGPNGLIVVCVLTGLELLMPAVTILGLRRSWRYLE